MSARESSWRAATSEGELSGKLPGASRGSIGVLSLYIRDASELKSADLNGLSDPYVVANVLGEKQRTHVIRKTLKPQWGSRLEFVAISFDKLMEKKIRLDVFDHDTLSKDDPLGGVTVDIAPLLDTNPMTVESKLSTQGTVGLTATWVELPPKLLCKGVLTVHLAGAEGLAAADKNGLSDPYVKLSVGASRHKSKTISKTLNPTWNEKFTFKGVRFELAQRALKLDVFDHDTFSHDDPLGSASVGLTWLELSEDRSQIEAKLSLKGHVQLSMQWVDEEKPPEAQHRMHSGATSFFWHRKGTHAPAELPSTAAGATTAALSASASRVAPARFYGVPLADVPLLEESSMSLRVPAVLVCLWEELEGRPAADGLASEGIFRLSADQTEVERVKNSLEAGMGRAALAEASSQCLAALVKLYLRCLPDDLWIGVRDRLEGVTSRDASSEPERQLELLQGILYELPLAHAELIVWMCEVMKRVNANESANFMTIEAVSTVFAPGLVPPPPGDPDPSTFMLWSDRGVEIAGLLVRAHMARPLSANPLNSKRKSVEETVRGLNAQLDKIHLEEQEAEGSVEVT